MRSQFLLRRRRFPSTYDLICRSNSLLSRKKKERKRNVTIPRENDFSTDSEEPFFISSQRE